MRHSQYKIYTRVVITLLTCFASLHAESPSESTKATPSEEEINNLAQEMGEETMSPFCPGRTLQACPSEDARQLKLEITSLLQKGYSKEAIKRRLYSMYSENISGIPQNNSFKNIAWLSPFLFTLLGFAVVYLGLRYMRKPTQSPLQDPPIDLKEIEEKLKR